MQTVTDLVHVRIKPESLHMRMNAFYKSRDWYLPFHLP